MCHVCIYLIVLPTFNHLMHACTWFAAEKPFIKRKRKRYVMSIQFIHSYPFINNHDD